jgi:hypothetical protein
MVGTFILIRSIIRRLLSVRDVYLEGAVFPVRLVRQVFTNEDNSIGVLYLITTDITMTYDHITTTYTTQANHFFAVLCAYTKLEMLSVSKKLNHTYRAEIKVLHFCCTRGV